MPRAGYPHEPEHLAFAPDLDSILHKAWKEPMGAEKSTQMFFVQRFSTNLRVMDVLRRKSWTSAPKGAFSCGPGGSGQTF